MLKKILSGRVGVGGGGSAHEACLAHDLYRAHVGLFIIKSYSRTLRYCTQYGYNLLMPIDYNSVIMPYNQCEG